MENSEEEVDEMMNESLLNNSPKGGFRTIPFILATEAFERLASCGISPNMIVYLMDQYHMEMATGSNLLLLWSSATCFTPVLGAIAADSLAGRFRTIGFGSVVMLLGMVLLLLTTLIPQARPPECRSDLNYICGPATFPQLLLLCTSLGLMSIGAGGIRSSCLAFGADQLEKVVKKGDQRALEHYFGWYYASCMFSIFIALIGIVYIQENMGWKVGFGVPAIPMFFSALAFFLASPSYVKLKAKSGLLLELFQVIPASFRKRHIELSSWTSNAYYHKMGSLLVLPSNKLRFLNKACIIIDAQQDLTMDGTATDPWSLCTVDQVEDLKILLRLIPIWSAGMIMAVNMCQNSFPVLQASSMNRDIGLGFKIPAASFGSITVICFTLWVVLYHCAILPLASRIVGKPVHLSARQRIGTGIFLSFLSMMVTAIIENMRRNRSVEEGNFYDSKSAAKMSAMWLIPQYCLNGFAEGLSITAQNEFYYSEFPKSMASIASNLCALGFSVANLVSSLMLSTVDNVTRGGGKEGWISSNINKGHYDYYYWILASLSMVNMAYFLICSKVYGPCKEEKIGILDED